MKKGFTLLEVLLVIVMFVVLTAVTVYVFRAILLSWSAQEIRAGIGINLYRGVEKMAREILEVKNVDSLNTDEIRFTDVGDNYCIYYLYNGNDAYPPNFGQATYELRKAALSGVVGGDLTTGTFTYGDGTIIIKDIVPPTTSDLSIINNIVTIDLSATRGNETIRSRTEVRPRNL